MRIIHASLHPYNLKMKRPWITARGPVSRREGWLIAVTSDSGITGWGDCAPLQAAGTESLTASRQALDECIRHISRGESDQVLDGLERLPPAARCGMETALLDLQARSQGVAMADLLGGKKRSVVRVNAACGNLERDVEQCVSAAVESGFKVIKFKVGLLVPEQEARFLRELARHAGDGISFRLDANGAWSPQQARRFVAAVEGVNVESIEEPLRQPDANQLRALQALCPYPLALDESLAGSAQASMRSLSSVRRLVLKPAVLGGPRSTLAWADIARNAGLEVVVTTTLESALGVAMVAQVAATLETDGVHGLVTGQWFESDTAALPTIAGGLLPLPKGSGIGLEPLPEMLQ